MFSRSSALALIGGQFSLTHTKKSLFFIVGYKFSMSILVSNLAYCHSHTLPLHDTTLNSLVDFYGGRKSGEKPSWHRREQHIKQIQHTYDPAQAGARTRDYRDERSHRCANHATLFPACFLIVRIPAHKTGHNVRWKGVKYINQDVHWPIRRVKEVIQIRLNPNTINRDCGIDL